MLGKKGIEIFRLCMFGTSISKKASFWKKSQIDLGNILIVICEKAQQTMND
jgi:hypothetical protein